MESIIKQSHYIKATSWTADETSWADFFIVKYDSGIMLMSISASAGLNTNTTYNFPIPFVSPPFCICYQQGMYRNFCSSSDTTATSFWVKVQDAFGYGDGDAVKVIAIGRWK